MSFPGLVAPHEQTRESSGEAPTRPGAVSYLAQNEKRQNKRKETLQRKHAWRERTAIEMRQKGAVPGAIADRLGISLAHVFRLLREQGVKLPRCLDTTEYPNEVPTLGRTGAYFLAA